MTNRFQGPYLNPETKTMKSLIRKYRIPLRLPFKTWQILAVLAFSFSFFLLWPLSQSTLQQQTTESIRILDRNGALLREIQPEGKGIPIPIEQVNEATINAVIAIEDRHFYRHIGINPISIMRAMKDNVAAGEVVSGGSTITMQVARLLLGHQQRTVFKKISEALFALRLEVHLTKEEILSIWLNRVYFGNQVHGIESAARLYFGKSAADLTVAEASFLSGLPQRPNGYNPFRYPDQSRQRHFRVLDAMEQVGYLSSEEARRLKTIELDIANKEVVFQAPHFVEYIRRLTAERNIQQKTISTTLDLPLQQTVQALAQSHLQRLGNDKATNAAAIVLDNSNGHILAYLGSADFWDEATQGQNDGIQMLRQPGSALKPFAYALALESKKYDAASILPDIELHIPEAGGAFSPMNYDKKFHGPVPLRTALASSYNVPAVRLVREYGAGTLIDLLHETGITSLNKGANHYGVGITLGNGEVRPLELARAYAALANGGSLAPLQVIKSDSSEASKLLRDETPPSRLRSISPETTFLITDILRDPEARAPGFGRYGPLELPFPVAVKTGTSKDYRDNWAVGYSPRYTVAVWVGNFDGSPMRRVSGVSGAGPLFHAIMLQLGSGGNFKTPASVESAMICPISGALPGKACGGTKREFFLSDTVPQDTCKIHQVVHIDSRNGLRATDQTPPQNTVPTRFAVYPEIYRDWMKKNKIPMPPDFPGIIETASSPLPQIQEASLEISYPESGMIFQLDPVLQASFQQIKLRGLSRVNLTEVTWWINDQKLEGSLRDAFWRLAPGDHEFMLTGLDVSGKLIKSKPVHIKVLSPTEGEFTPVTLFP